MRIYLIGYMASGKTTIGNTLAGLLHIAFTDMDAMIAATEGLSVADIFEQQGEAYFRRAEQAALRQTFLMENVLIACGGGTPCFENNMEQMNRNGLTIWLNTPLETIYERLLKARQQRPLLAGIDDAALWLHVQRQIKERLPFYSRAHMMYEPHRELPEQLCGRIKEIVNK